MIEALAVAASGSPAILEHSYGSNSLERWLVALALTLATLVLLRVLRHVLAKRVAAFAKKTETLLDDYLAGLLAATKPFFLAVLALYAGAQVLQMPVLVLRWIVTVTVVSFLIQLGVWADALLRLWLEHYQTHLEEDAGRVTTMKATTFVVRVILFSVVALLALDNIPGVHVTTLITSMGIGGVAVALAAQNILTDLFASLIISLDQPFVIGDFIIAGEDMGTVERVGLKTTRVRSLTGEELIFSNSDLLKSRIRNYKRMAERRILFSFGVTYQTPAEKVAAIPGMVREIVEAQEQVRFERAHFKEFGDSSLIFHVVYWVKVPDYNVYMDVQQAVNLALYTRFAREGIDFAYPTQTLFLEGGAGVH